jgi:hypothetical protein
MPLLLTHSGSSCSGHSTAGKLVPNILCAYLPLIGNIIQEHVPMFKIELGKISATDKTILATLTLKPL